MEPLEELREEHGGIMKVFSILQGLTLNLEQHNPEAVDDLRRILEFLTVFVDQCHHAKEEEFLFPAMEKAHTKNGHLIEELISEHEKGRKMVVTLDATLGSTSRGGEQDTDQLVKTIQEYIQLLRTHIRKENGILFPEARELFSDSDRQVMAREFEELEEKRIGKGRHEAFHRMIEELIPYADMREERD
jgi:hemerythrin-like domain-containing protein